MRLLSISVALAVGLLGGGDAAAHAGHDHAPEAPAETVGEVAPRFYAQSDAVEAVLVLPEADQDGEPRLYFVSKETNRPVENATVSAEILSGGDGKLTVAPDAMPGAYVLSGLGDSASTRSLMIELEAGDLIEILSMENVVVAERAASAGAEGASGAPASAAEALGLPRYLILGLLMMNALVGGVILLCAMHWIADRLRRPGPKLPLPPEQSFLFALAAVGVLAAAPRAAPAHAGDDHGGAALAASAALTSGTRHFVPIQSQIDAGVQTTRVQEIVLPRSFKALGKVEIRSDLRAVVTPPVEGRLVPHAREGGERGTPVVGERVEKGETLVVVEQILPASEKVTLITEQSQLQAELREAQQELTLAAQNKARADQLTKVISAQELERTRATHRIAEERVKGLRERLKTLESALGGDGPTVREVPVIAPISGMITEAHVTVGEYVTREKPLLTVVSLDEVFVGADVFESDLQAIQGAGTARITLEAFPDEAFVGTFHAVSQEVDPDTRALHVLFNVKNPESKLRGGAFVNVAIESDDKRPLLIVPKSAVLSQDGMRHVLLKLTPEVFASTPVIVSEFREETAVVAYGLQPGDRVAVTGLYQIRMSPVLARGR